MSLYQALRPEVNEVTELTESRSGEVDHQAQVRGPTLHKTNFDLVTEVLGCHKMPLGCNIYYSAYHKAQGFENNVVCIILVCPECVC